MFEADRGQPAAVGLGPTPHAAVDLAVTQEKALQVLTGLAEHAVRRRPRPHQVAHCLVGGIRHQTGSAHPPGAAWRSWWHRGGWS
jgi:hypothetical protein